MTRPTLADTSNWQTVYDSVIVTVENADLAIAGGTMSAGAWRVTVHEHESQLQRGPDGGFTLINKKSKLFYGETAWSDAERMASDFDRNAIGL